MRYLYLWLAALLLIATPASAEEKGTLDRIYKGALNAAEKVFGPEERPHKVDKTKQPQIIIKGGEMRYNGKILKPGDSFANWKKVLGKPSRFSLDRIYTWDNLGIAAWLQSKGADGPGFTDKITEMDIFFNQKPRDPTEGLVTTSPDGTPIKKWPDFKPKNVFPGYLEIDGAGVDRTSKVWEVNWNKNMFDDPVRRGFQRAHLRTIYRAVSPPPEHALDMSFHTDKNGQDGMIYYLSISD